jgi:hypothetical protein
MADQNSSRIDRELLGASSALADVWALVSAAHRLAEPTDSQIACLLGMAIPQILAIQDRLEEAIEAPCCPQTFDLAPTSAGVH